ncbi:MAG: AAA family ATPase [Planctomycetes bacterium]|nr:AAA family ATPase [Planctomycetota bacterium]
MHIEKIKIEGFKTLLSFEVNLNKNLNIIVGDNETGKTTLLEAINLVLSCQLDSRNIQYELNPYIFNSKMVKDYFEAVAKGDKPSPPKVLIEAYFNDDNSPEITKLKGTHNEDRLDCPGLSLLVHLNEEFADDFWVYMMVEDNPGLLTIEYYHVTWLSFAGDYVATRSLPFGSTIIDTSLVKGQFGPNKYIAKIIRDVLKTEERLLHTLSLEYRKLKNAFIKEKGVKVINEYLETLKGDITEKTLTVAMDMSARSTWESTITAHLDEIPFDSIGKGEQRRVQMKLAIEAAGKANVLLIEEPENHLSHSNMARLLEEVGHKSDGRQTILTTHSNFVLNKLGMDKMTLLSAGNPITLGDLSTETRDYFMKLPGYNTLRLILSSKTILVEGPSDELIVQKAYLEEHDKLPLEDGVDVISVMSLSFKRFLEIGKLLKLNIRVVTDNDGKVAALKKKYTEYIDRRVENIRICFDIDEDYPDLEAQLLKVNTLNTLNELLDKDFANDEDLLSYMRNNKTDTALKVFEAVKPIIFPKYILDAIN